MLAKASISACNENIINIFSFTNYYLFWIAWWQLPFLRDIPETIRATFSAEVGFLCQWSPIFNLWRLSRFAFSYRFLHLQLLLKAETRYFAPEEVVVPIWHFLAVDSIWSWYNYDGYDWIVLIVSDNSTLIRISHLPDGCSKGEKMSLMWLRTWLTQERWLSFAGVCGGMLAS